MPKKGFGLVDIKDTCITNVKNAIFISSTIYMSSSSSSKLAMKSLFLAFSMNSSWKWRHFNSFRCNALSVVLCPPMQGSLLWQLKWLLYFNKSNTLPLYSCYHNCTTFTKPIRLLMSSKIQNLAWHFLSTNEKSLNKQEIEKYIQKKWRNDRLQSILCLHI